MPVANIQPVAKPGKAERERAAEELGKIIKTARDARDWSQEQLAAKAQEPGGEPVHQTHIGRIENARARPSPELLKRIAKALELDAARLERLLAAAHGWSQKEPRAVAPPIGKLPVLGQVRAGPWMEAREDDPPADDWEEADPKLTKGRRAFWVRVAEGGDSMNREGIFPGDLLLVSLEPHLPGKPALVRLGDEVTVKFVEEEHGYVILTPSSTNPAHEKQRIAKSKWIQQGGVTCRIVGYKAFRRF